MTNDLPANMEPPNEALLRAQSKFNLRVKAAELPEPSPDDRVFQNLTRNPKFSRDMTLAAFHMIGGLDAYAVWAGENKSDFYTKMFGKTLEKPEQEGSKRGIEDLLDMIDNKPIDAEYEEV